VRPLIVVEGPDTAYHDALADLRAAGWTLVDGWEVRSGMAVHVGSVTSADEAAAALLAAVSGAGLAVHARAEREVVDRLCDDLRRLGRVDHRVDDGSSRQRLTRQEQALVDLLLDGMTLGAAARELGLARRTADRRLASVRAKLGVETTAQAVVAAARRRAT
jgi:DNA-binding NarL/FixJ family response regulator